MREAGRVGVKAPAEAHIDSGARTATNGMLGQGIGRGVDGRLQVTPWTWRLCLMHCSLQPKRAAKTPRPAQFLVHFVDSHRPHLLEPRRAAAAPSSPTCPSAGLDPPVPHLCSVPNRAVDTCSIEQPPNDNSTCQTSFGTHALGHLHSVIAELLPRSWT